MQQLDFSNMKPPEFRSDKDLIISLRWISEVEGCFYTCSCPEDQKLKFALNVLRSGEKNWWEFVTQSFSLVERGTVTWEQFWEIFRAKYVPLMEREQLAQEYLLLKQTTELMTKITKMVTQRAIFYPKYAISEQMQMLCYLSMLKAEI